MSNARDQEVDAFFSFFATFDLSRPVATVADLSDGAALFEILSVLDDDYFRPSTRPSDQLSDNWVMRFSALKRIYRLMTQYFADVLRQPTSALEVPDLQAMAKDHNVDATLIMCRLTIVIAVQCERNSDIIPKIQGLSEIRQHRLMKAIEQVMSKVQASGSAGETGMTDDDHFYQVQSERSRLLAEKDAVEKAYQALMEEQRTLQANYDDILSEKQDIQSRLQELQRELELSKDDKADVILRAEIDRLKGDLQKSEDNLAIAEGELDKQTQVVSELTRKVDELQVKADEAARLKDQVDEYRHAADRLQKTENVMEKYKKKLQEGADLRQQIKSLEKQNADLVDKNAALEEEYRKVASYKPLMESYKTQITELETKGSSKSKEIETLRYELDQTRAKLRLANEERAKDSETLELYQERVRELELSSHRPVPSARSRAQENGDGTNGDAEEGQGGETLADVEGVGQGLDEELDDAISGTTMTDLKLQVKKLSRELEAAKNNQGDASRTMVLENLLEDANRMKARYEADYLAAHREKLKLQNDLEEIRSGKAMGDGAEAAIALRQRLNETVDQLDALKKEHTELEVKCEALQKDLTIAKSDLNLVNKDQLEILATLRESVAEDKVGLEADMQHLRDQIQELKDKNRMQLEQINGLLLEKVNLQTEGIGQRELMLQRERAFGDLRATLSGKDVPEDIKQRLLGMHEENVQLREQLKASQDKLVKAKAFIKSQDKLFKEEHAKTASAAPGTSEEAESHFRAQIKILEEEVARAKRTHADLTKRYRREQELMLSAIHSMGMKTARDHLGHPQQQARPGPTSWLGQQRRNLGQSLRR